jgi:predicted RNase H-like nuclease
MEGAGERPIRSGTDTLTVSAQDHVGFRHPEARPVGVDGCPAGWLATWRADGDVVFGIFPTVDDIVSQFTPYVHLMIDVPIGLPWRDVPVRPCDRRAREILGPPRRSSVFPVPCRAALQGADRLDASRINLMELDRKIGVQTWAISAKIAEVDRFLRSSRPGEAELHEIHPEICFWALAGGRPMRHGKKTAEGRRERLEALARREPQSRRLLASAASTTHRREVGLDDVLDALAAFVTAEAHPDGSARVVGDPPTDEKGLPMEMVHVAFT